MSNKIVSNLFFLLFQYFFTFLLFKIKNRVTLRIRRLKAMKNKKKVIGAFISAILFIVVGILAATDAGAPAWLVPATNALSVVCGALGITFTVPNSNTPK